MTELVQVLHGFNCNHQLFLALFWVLFGLASFIISIIEKDIIPIVLSSGFLAWVTVSLIMTIRGLH